MPEPYDFIVIGGGSAGYAAARYARSKVGRVAVVDNSEHLGGLCIRRGCMPSKTVIYSAEVLHHARHGEKFGLQITRAEADMSKVLKRKQAMVEEFAEERVRTLQSDRFSLYRSSASFINETAIELEDGTRLTGDKILISTGSTVNWPPVPGLTEVGALTSDDILDLDFLPESIIVLGGGIVSCELAQYLNRMGSTVTQIQRSPHILKEFSPEVSTVIETAFRDEGISLFTDTAIREINKTPLGRISVTFQQGTESHTLEADHLFNALGRIPNTDGLNLENAGVETLKSGHIACDGSMRTSQPNIYAAGDVAGPDEIVHIAVKQGVIAARHALGETVEPIDYDNTLHVIFTDPQVAVSGYSEKILRQKGIPCHTADFPFDDHGKSILMEAKYGYVKIHAEKNSGRILGAECVGKDAGELIHALNVAIGLGATVSDLLKIDWYHPTLSEIWEYPLEEIAGKLEPLS